MLPEFKQSVRSGALAVQEGKGKEVGLEQDLDRKSLGKQRQREPKQSPLKRDIPVSGFFTGHSSRAFS